MVLLRECVARRGIGANRELDDHAPIRREADSGTQALHPSYLSDRWEHQVRLRIVLTAALLAAPLGPAAAGTRITQTVKVTKTVTVRTVTGKVRRKAFRRYVYGAQTVAFVRRIHPESCFLPPDVVVALNALGPYCDSPRGWRRIVVRY
jgi:hypothetical protein